MPLPLRQVDEELAPGPEHAAASATGAAARASLLRNEVTGALVELTGDRARQRRPRTSDAATGAEARALVHEGRVGDGPSVVALADDGSVVDSRIVEEHLVEERVSRELAQRSDLDARLMHVQREPGDALVLGNLGIRTCDQHAEVSDLAS